MAGIYLNRDVLDASREWIFKSIQDVKETGFAKDIHVDEFVDVSELDKFGVVSASINFFRDVMRHLKVKLNAEIVVYLSIELTEFGNRIKGSPSSFEELCEEYDQFSMPEIIIYRPNPIIYPPLVELYRSPLIFKEFEGSSEFLFFYKENRTLDSLMEDDEFTREFNVIYNPHHEA